MTIAGVVLFASAVAVLTYVYAGYPVAMAVLSRLRGRVVRKGPYEPQVTILIAAHNEARHLEATIRNKLELAYPRERLELIVVSDSSTDGTDDIVRRFSGEGVVLLRQEPRAGKTAALNRGLEIARGEVIVFSDANSLYDSSAVRFLVENFRDPEVGYVTGRMVYTDEAGTVTGEGCGAYMRYENFLRAMETDTGSIVGVDGGIDAVRTVLYLPMRPDQLPDLVLPLRVIEQGYRVVYEPRAILKESALGRAEDEYRMRVRVSLRALWALLDMKHLMNPLKYGIYSFQLLSHKMLRYVAFAFLAMAYASNLALLGSGGSWVAVFLAQNLLYASALACHLLLRRGCTPSLLWPMYYFVLLNVAAAHAFLKLLRGERLAVWKPRLG